MFVSINYESIRIHFINCYYSVYVNEEENLVADKAVDVVMNYLSRNTKVGVKVELQKVVGNRTDAKGLLESRKEITMIKLSKNKSFYSCSSMYGLR